MSSPLPPVYIDGGYDGEDDNMPPGSRDGSPGDRDAVQRSNMAIVQPTSVEGDAHDVPTYGIHLILPHIHVPISGSTTTSITSSGNTTVKTLTTDQREDYLQAFANPSLASEPAKLESYDSCASIESGSDRSMLRMGSNEDTDYEPLRKLDESVTRPLRERRKRISARQRNARRSCKRIGTTTRRSFQDERSPPRKQILKRFLRLGAAYSGASTSGTRTGEASTSWSGRGSSKSSRSNGETKQSSAAGDSGAQSQGINAADRDEYNSSKSYRSHSYENASFSSWSPTNQIFNFPTETKITPFQKPKLAFKSLINSYMSDSSDNADNSKQLSISPKEVLNFAEKLMGFLNNMTVDYVLKTPPINGKLFMDILSVALDVQENVGMNKNSSLRALIAASNNVADLHQYDVLSISFPRFFFTDGDTSDHGIVSNGVEKSTNTEEDIFAEIALDLSEEKEEDVTNHSFDNDDADKNSTSNSSAS